MKKFHFVFSGGSTKIPLHVGFLKAVHESGIEPVGYYGNSAGSIIAACLAVGKDVQFIEKLILKLNFKKFAKVSIWENLLYLFQRSYLSSGDYLYSYLNELFEGKRFKDLESYLCVTGHSLNKNTYFAFNNDSSPDMEVAKAVRISSSVPVLFKPVLYNGQYWVDGGLSNDFPVNLVKDKGISYIGHIIQNIEKIKDVRKINKIKMLEVVLGQLIQANSEEPIRQNRKGYVVRTEYHKSMMEFSVSKKEKKKMIALAYENTTKYLEENSLI